MATLKQINAMIKQGITLRIARENERFEEQQEREKKKVEKYMGGLGIPQLLK